ncbi:hypothetical protein OKX59_05240 [Lactobacillus delbrueckii subsp. indicus]|uniref:hypothetical protein n=1 Tax=Lactobacillus delbrueckii TaxID=1584 RepID=UPI002221484B|nr:hypothetical protein [Lactobacillus delbrueckii]UYX11996.1 hypothetical protein OJ966_05580 [Lactobacillus delbrueckii]UYY83806.1 hypothetical protein OKX59_05240 [Lactobacillus delbrueckii subsp. indicus]
MKKIRDAGITFVSALLVIFIDSNFDIMSFLVFQLHLSHNVASHIDQAFQALVITVISAILNGIVPENKPCIKIKYLDDSEQEIINKKLTSVSIDELDSTNILWNLSIKYSKKSQWILRKGKAKIHLFINPNIGKFELQNGYIEKKGSSLEYESNGLNYDFLNEFKPSQKMTSVQKKLVFQCFQTGLVEIQAELLGKNIMYTYLFKKICAFEQKQLIINSEIKQR